MDLPPLTEGRLLKRYKRFLADIDFGSAVETVHCPNPGAMTGLAEPGSRVWCSTSGNPKRKLPRTLELVDAGGVLVGVNTSRPNSLAKEALEAGAIPAFAEWPVIEPESVYEKGTRFDFKLSGPGTRPPLYLEVKNVHLFRPDGPNPGAAEFPDSVTARGAKHLHKLADIAESGGRAAMLYVVQRGDGDRFALAADIDPVYARAFERARGAGVLMEAWRCSITLESIEISGPVPVEAREGG